MFLELDAEVLRARLNARVTHPGVDWDEEARKLGMTGLYEMAAVFARLGSHRA